MMLIMMYGLAGILLMIILVVVIFSYVNSILFPYFPVYSNSWIFPCNHSLFCFPSKISLSFSVHNLCPSFFRFLWSSSLPLFHNWPFPFPTFRSRFFLLLSTFLICWILLFLASLIILFPAFSFLSFLLILHPPCSGFQGVLSSFMMGRGGMTAAQHVVVNM